MEFLFSPKFKNRAFYLEPRKNVKIDSSAWFSRNPLNEKALSKMLHRVLMIKGRADVGERKQCDEYAEEQCVSHTMTTTLSFSSAETVKPANSSTVFGGSKCMCTSHFVNDFFDFFC